MDNEIIVVRGYTLRDYNEQVKRSAVEDLPDSVSDDSTHGSSRINRSPIFGASAFHSSDRLLLAGRDEFDLQTRSVSVCSFSSLNDPECYDTVPRYYQQGLWPEHLRVCCAYCSLLVPRPYPICTMEKGREARSFRVHSVYCSPAHIKREFQHWPRDNRYEEAFQATISVISELAGRPVPDFPLGLDKLELARFRGAGHKRDIPFLDENNQIWEEYLRNLT